MTWEPIQDLPENWREFVSTEIDSLAEAWFNAYQSLKNTSALQEFNERLRREWSIETGILERLYTIDRGTTRLLIEQGIDAALITSGATNRPVQEVIEIIKAQREALDGLFDVAESDRPLSLHYIRSLHQTLLRNEQFVEAFDQFGKIALTEAIKGDWRKQKSETLRADNTRHEYCPPEHIQSEMERLIALHQEHLAKGVAPQIEAAWLHHRFVQIHPFQDGNGRVARCLATLVLIRAKRFPLVVTRDQRVEYLDALKFADYGDIAPLVRIFEQIEKKSYIQALNLSEDMLYTREKVSSLVESIAHRYRNRKQETFDQVFNLAQNLLQIAQQCFEDYASQMRDVFRQQSTPIAIKVSINSSENDNWFSQDIVETARKLNYFANLNRPRLWVRLRLQDESGFNASKASIVVSFHYLGKENRGVMMASAFLNINHPVENIQDHDEAAPSSRTFRETHSITSDAFTFAYTDSNRIEQRQREFRRWLEQAVAVGLAEWQKQL